MARVKRIACDREVHGSGLTCSSAPCIARLWHIVSKHPLDSDCREDCSRPDTPEAKRHGHHAD